MWTGFWKLTAMVGVVGVGLLAAFHSQSGKEFKFPGMSSSVAKNDTPTNDEDTAADQSDVDEPDDLSASPPVSLSASSKSGNDKSRSQFDDLSDDPPSLTPSKTTKSEKRASDSSKAPIVPVNRKVTSRSDDSAPDETIQQADSMEDPVVPANETLIEELPGDMKNASSRDDQAEPSEPVSEGTEPQELEPLAISEDAENNAEEKSETAILEPEPEVTEDASQTVSKEELEAPPPPRSKRARRNFESTDVPEEQPAKNDPADEPSLSEPLNEKTEPANPELTESREEETTVEEPSPPVKEEPSSRKPRAITKDLPAEITDEPATTREPSVRKGKTPPASLPLDLDQETPSRSTKSNRDPQLQRAGKELETADIFGDGVAGDASQSGVQQPRLTIEKVSQQQAILGQPLIYSIIIRNIGSVDAHNIVIEDRIPKGTKLEGTSPQAELSGKRLIWNQPVLRPNEEKKISIKVIPQQEGPIGSVARVHFATEVSAEIVVAAPQLDLTVRAPREVRVGQKFDLVYSLKNVGTVDANDILVRDILPEELLHEKGDDIECPIGRLAPNEAREIVLSVVAEKTGSVVNKAVLYMDRDVKKTLESPIDVIGEVLVLTRDGQDRVYVERPVTFKNNIRNDGNQRADKIKLAETVPPGMEFSTASDGGRFDPNLRAVVWTIGPLAPGSDKTVTVKYVPQKTGTFDAKITATGSAGSTAAVKSTIDVVGKPELLMETLSATGSVTLGDRITSRFQLKNTGTAVANDVQLRIRLPRQLRLSSVRGAKYQQVNDMLVFESIDELAPKSAASYELVLEATDEGDAQITLDIFARHLNKPGHRVEMIQIAKDTLK